MIKTMEIINGIASPYYETETVFSDLNMILIFRTVRFQNVVYNMEVKIGQEVRKKNTKKYTLWYDMKHQV